MNVSFSFFMKDILDIRSEKFVLESLKSIQGQTDDIMVFDYNPKDDRLKTMLFGLGYRYIPVEGDLWFDTAKMSNKMLMEAKHDLTARLTPDVIYPDEFGNYIRTFYKYHDPEKYYLTFKLYANRADEIYMDSNICYKPFLIKARGYDEHTSYYQGSHAYERDLLKVILKLNQYISQDYFALIHRDHPIIDKKACENHNQEKGLIHYEYRIMNLITSFENGVKKVKNSYW